MKTIDLDQLSKELGNFYGRSQKEVRKAVSRGLQKSISDLVAASPVDTGLYSASWDFRIDEKQAIIGNHAPYAGIIEYGTRPFTPPLAPLLRWAKRVLQDPSQPPDFSPEVWKLARATQKKIQQHGMVPRHVLENTLPKIIENIKQEIKHG